MNDKHDLCCPSCQGPLKTITKACAPCGIKVEADFKENEFSRLSPEQLHLLRIFLLCEGKVRDMESALGLSYPTIRSRIQDLRQSLFPDDKIPEPPAPSDPLDLLAQGKISFEDTLKQIRTRKKKGL